MFFCRSYGAANWTNCDTRFPENWYVWSWSGSHFGHVLTGFTNGKGLREHILVGILNIFGGHAECFYERYRASGGASVK